MFTKISTILLFCQLITQINAYKILAVFPIQSFSHYIFVTPLLHQLAERGHQVTSISPYRQNQPLKNFRDIVLMDQYKNFSLGRHNHDMHHISLWELYTIIHNLSVHQIKSVMGEQQIQQLLKDPREKFDLVLTEVCYIDVLFGFAAHFGAPIVGVAPSGARTLNAALTGAPTLPAFMPFTYFAHDETMTFYKRLHNVYGYILEYVFMRFIHWPTHAKLFEQYFGHTGHTLADVRRNLSLVLLNQHSSLGISRPLVPNMIEVAGMHINSYIHPLDSNLQQILDNATEGAIFFSLGTNLQSSELSPERLNAIINTFRALPQQIIWKLEDSNVTNLPDNVFVRSWFFQNDVLAHPNIKLFISHGGLLGVTEAIAHGKPLLGIPFFGDQFMNMERAKRLGFALGLSLNDFSETKFLHAIQELLSNSSYTKMAKTLSQRYHDKPQSALETAIYWVEYVLRHRGAHHLRCVGKDLNIFQYYSLDVVALILVILMVLVILSIFAFRLLCQCSRHGLKKTKLKIK